MQAVRNYIDIHINILSKAEAPIQSSHFQWRCARLGCVTHLGSTLQFLHQEGVGTISQIISRLINL